MAPPIEKSPNTLQDSLPINQGEKEESVGEYLKKSRLEKQENIGDISKKLRISQAYLEALEADDRANLPEQVYTLGFLKNYAAYLGLDENVLVKKFKIQFSQMTNPAALTFPLPAPGRTVPSTLLVAIGIGMAIGVVAFWFYIKSSAMQGIEEIETGSTVIVEGIDNPISSSLPDEAEEALQAVSGIEPESLVTQAYPTFPVQDVRPYAETRAVSAYIDDKNIYLGPGNNLIIQATSDSWVELKELEGEILINRILKPGESKEFEARPGLVFSTGNAGGLIFNVNGKYYKSIGKTGEVLKNMILKFEDPTS